MLALSLAITAGVSRGDGNEGTLCVMAKQKCISGDASCVDWRRLVSGFHPACDLSPAGLASFVAALEGPGAQPRKASPTRVGGASDLAQRPPAQQQQPVGVNPTDDPELKCIEGVNSRPTIGELASKFPYATMHPTFAMLADQTIVTPHQKQLLADWFDARERCSALGDSWRNGKFPPEWNQMILDSWVSIREIGLRLYTGTISFGQANQEIDKARRTAQAIAESLVEKYRNDAVLAAQRRQEEDAAKRASVARADAEAAARIEQMERIAAAQEQAARAAACLAARQQTANDNANAANSNASRTAIIAFGLMAVADGINEAKACN